MHCTSFKLKDTYRYLNEGCLCLEYPALMIVNKLYLNISFTAFYFVITQTYGCKSGNPKFFVAD